MRHAHRRQFLRQVGGGMLVASVGWGMAADLGLAPAWSGEEPGPLDFGPLEALAATMQETSAEQLQPRLVELLRSGTTLHDLVKAAALANARSFGGEDYIGFHTLMALGPAYAMAERLPEAQQALPVLKVLYRNTSRMQATGGRAHEALRQVTAADVRADATPAETQLREAVRAGDKPRAEQLLAGLTRVSPESAYNAVLHCVEDGAEVHRVVLAHRAWDLLDLVGIEHAQTMLRQSLRYCIKQEEKSSSYYASLRTMLPKLLDDFRLAERPAGERAMDDAWLEEFSRTLFVSSPEQAAAAVAAALSEGIRSVDISNALALAANQIVLRDAGRTPQQAQPNKPAGSVHGDSHGVHACDSAHAWRGIAKVADSRHAAAALILGGYQVARDRANGGPDFLEWQPRPHSSQLEKLGSQEASTLLQQLDGAIREQNQEFACALVHRYGELGYAERPLFDALLHFAISEDGALHAEKFYRTTTEEFAALPPAFRWRQAVALARVTASEYGQPAPGQAEARQLLGVPS